MSDHAVLCYVDPPWAFFTTQPLDKQWGDDWNDAPYEHNAGDPYLPHPPRDGENAWQIVKVAYEANDCEAPCDPGRIRDASRNSPWSVEQINARETPWLADPMYGVRWGTEEAEPQPIAWAGTTLAEFREIIRSRGGVVYEATS